jgi:hypothetical protein
MTTKQTQKHFFAASIWDWRVDTDIEKLIRTMKKEGQSFSLYLVPVAVDVDYDIEFYKPQVEGTVFLTTIHPKTK